MRPLHRRPALTRLIERLQRATRVDRIVLATTVNRDDDVLEVLAGDLGIGCYRGLEHDVLDRVLRAAEANSADTIVEITGDCPLVDPDIVDRVTNVALSGEWDLAWNQLNRTYPIGFDVRVFPTRVLAEVERSTLDPTDREHVSLYIWEHPDRFRITDVPSGLPRRYWDLRLALDTEADLRLLEAIFDELYPTDPHFPMSKVLDLLDRRPDLVELNRDIKPKPIR